MAFCPLSFPQQKKRETNRSRGVQFSLGLVCFLDLSFDFSRWIGMKMLLKVQQFSEDKWTEHVKMNLHLSRCKRKDVKTNWRYIDNESWNCVDRHTGGLCRKHHLFIQNFSCSWHFCIFLKFLYLVLCSALVWGLLSSSNFWHFLAPERSLSAVSPVGCCLG